MIKKCIHWIPPVVCMAVIFTLSSEPRFTATGEYGPDFIIFKTLHMCEYGYLALLMFYAVYKTIVQNLERAIGLAGALSIIYATSDEFHQMFIATRSGTPRDIVIDGIGILIVLAFIYAKWPTLKKRF